MPGAAGPPVQVGSGTIRRGAFICRQTEYDLVRQAGASQSRRRLVVGYLKPAPDGCTRTGFIVSRRYDNRAVERNRARRRLREAFRLSRHAIAEPIWLVLIARQHLHGARTQDVQRELLSVLASLGVLDAASGVGP